MSPESTRKSNIAIICGGLILLVIMGFGIFSIAHGSVPGLAKDVTFDPQDLSTTPPAAASATKIAKAFLDDWSQQEYEAACARTDSPKTTAAALQGYADRLKLTSVAFDAPTVTGTDHDGTVDEGGSGDAAQPAARTEISFHATAQTSAGVWTYQGALEVLQDNDGNAAVRWTRSVLFPALGDDQSLVLGDLPAGEGTATVVASDGRTELSGFPSLVDIAGTIRDNVDSGDGSPGTGIMIDDAQGKYVSTVQVFAKEKEPVVKTTIDARLQAAAETAVKDPQLDGKPAGVAALDWRTGHILAVAYAGGDGDIAINAVKAPGSTMKIITAAALFDKVGLTPASAAPCTDSILARGQTFHNDAGVSPSPGASIADAFRVSCNTAFIKDGFHYLVNDGDASALHDEAASVFGFGSWSIGGGVGTRDPSVPPDVQGGDQAAQFIGQGRVTATPLVMASVAATVRNGGFKQPIILPGQPQVPASRPISGRTAGYLQTMMRSVAVSGTAAPRLSGLADVGAKTGTAEEGVHTNGWLTAYDDTIAVAALVEGGSTGVDSAGHVVRDLLTAP